MRSKGWHGKNKENDHSEWQDSMDDIFKMFGIGHGDHIDKARGILVNPVARDDRILDHPPVKIAVELSDSSV